MKNKILIIISLLSIFIIFCCSVNAEPIIQKNLGARNINKNIQEFTDYTNSKQFIKLKNKFDIKFSVHEKDTINMSVSKLVSKIVNDSFISDIPPATVRALLIWYIFCFEVFACLFGHNMVAFTSAYVVGTICAIPVIFVVDVMAWIPISFSLATTVVLAISSKINMASILYNYGIIGFLLACCIVVPIEICAFILVLLVAFLFGSVGQTIHDFWCAYNLWWNYYVP